MNGVTLSYSGVHCIYYLAEVIASASILDRFHCSIFSGQKFWGRLLSLIRAQGLTNRTRPGIPPYLVDEYPAPLLGHLLIERITKQSVDWVKANGAFDRHVASQLRNSKSRIFVGVETCAMHSFESARCKRMHTVLDCPQLHPEFMRHAFLSASHDLQLPSPPEIDSPAMTARKQREFEMADHMLMLTDLQADSFVRAGFDRSRMTVTHFWPDTGFWLPPTEFIKKEKGKLRVLFVGSLSFRKGLPYLLQAAKQFGRSVELTLVGPKGRDGNTILNGYESCYTWVPPMTKQKLREYYWASDLLVLPSLADACGWVVMEAMACGLPVLVTDNCGAPVPDQSWRVPVMNSDALAEKFLELADMQDLTPLRNQAIEFMKKHTLAAFQEKIRLLFTKLLNES